MKRRRPEHDREVENKASREISTPLLQGTYDFQRPPLGHISCAAQYFWLTRKFCKARKGRVADNRNFSQAGKDETSSERCVCVGVCAVEVEKTQT